MQATFRAKALRLEICSQVRRLRTAFTRKVKLINISPCILQVVAFIPIESIIIPRPTIGIVPTNTSILMPFRQ
jgi:hypothetical protein